MKVTLPKPPFTLDFAALGISFKPVRPYRYIVTDGGCWEIVSHLATHNDGYPVLRHRQNNHKLVRFLYERLIAPLGDQFLLHQCDNPKCFNLKHVRPGTAKENSIDMVDRGHSTRGEKNPASKLTLSQVKEIKQIGRSKPAAEVGAMYGIHPMHVSRIRSSRRWSWV